MPSMAMAVIRSAASAVAILVFFAEGFVDGSAHKKEMVLSHIKWVSRFLNSPAFVY